MVEFLREWVKPTAVKRQEMMNAYLDGELSSRERNVFERFLADDEALQQELADRETIKSQLRQLPRLAVPRNFILDVNTYGRPARRPFSQTAYPILRGATVLAAFLFVFVFGFSMFAGGMASESAVYDSVAFEQSADTAVENAAKTAVESEAVTESETAEESEVAPAAPAAEAAPIDRTPADGIVAADEVAEPPMAAGSDMNDAAVDEEEMPEEEGIFDNAAAEVEEEGSDFPVAAVEESATDTEDTLAAEKTATATRAVPTVTATPIPTATATATPSPTPLPQSRSAPSPNLSDTQLIQIGLLLLFLILLTLTIYTRKRSG